MSYEQYAASLLHFAPRTDRLLPQPLQLILGPLADVMEKPYLAPVDAERLRTVQRNAQRLLGMVNTVPRPFVLAFDRIAERNVS